MEFRCINAKGMEGILTLGKVYKGEYAKHLTYIKIYRADDKNIAYCTDDRFEEVIRDTDPILWGDPEVKINRYSLYAEEKP